MRTVVVFRVRHATGERWLWALTNPTPPGFEALWLTDVGGGNPIVLTGFDGAQVLGTEFDYQVRQSQLDETAA